MGWWVQVIPSATWHGAQPTSTQTGLTRTVWWVLWGVWEGGRGCAAAGMLAVASGGGRQSGWQGVRHSIGTVCSDIV